MESGWMLYQAIHYRADLSPLGLSMDHKGWDPVAPLSTTWIFGMLESPSTFHAKIALRAVGARQALPVSPLTHEP